MRGLDAGLEGTTAYLASEYVAAETLDVALRHLAPAPLDRALPILTQIADAIDAAWAAGLGHGALHPRDVFVTVDAHTVRLTGFGVVPAMESIGVKAPVRRPYTAPERVNGDPWDIRADVYSLGAIAHELLTGRRPAGFGEQDGAMTTGTSPEQRIQIRRVLSASLAEHPQHRFQSARAFTDALAAVARGDASIAIPGHEGHEEEEHEEHEEDEGHEEKPAEAAASVAPLFAVAEQAVVEPEVAAVTPPRPPVEPAAAPPAAPEPVALRAFPDLREPLPSEAATVGKLDPREPLPSEAASVGRLDLGADFSHSALRTSHPALESAVGRDAPPFSWTVALAIAAAGIAIGIVIGYGVGRRAEPASTAVKAPSAQTDVPIGSDPASPEPPPAPPEPMSPGGTAVPPAIDASRDAVEAGRLIVRSVPPGALVTVDGRPHGQTPVTVPNLPLGEHSLEVARSGFVPHRQEVVLTARGPSRTISVQLRAGLPMPGVAARGATASGLGSIFVDSRPQAARVIIDGRFVGVTPVRVAEMAAGTHAIRLERAGYFSFTTSVGVKAGEQARVTAALEER